MTKQEQFLWIVQTAIIVNAVRLSTQVRPDREMTGIGLTGNWGAISDAIRASELIPADMDADTAADEYCTYMLANQRQEEVEAQGHPIACPDWLHQSRTGAASHGLMANSDILYSPIEVGNAGFGGAAHGGQVATE